MARSRSRNFSPASGLLEAVRSVSVPRKRPAATCAPDPAPGKASREALPAKPNSEMVVSWERGEASET